MNLKNPLENSGFKPVIMLNYINAMSQKSVHICMFCQIVDILSVYLNVLNVKKIVVDYYIFLFKEMDIRLF
jgi:hypothetical protein